MLRPGPRNLITDVDGILVGNAQDEALRSGVTVVLPEPAALAAVDVRGGATGTRETDLLHPAATNQRVDAVALSGGSAFGLDAASGVVHWLAAQGRGLEVRGFRVPIVPAAILFDLANGGDKAWGDEPPYRQLGKAAAAAAGLEFGLGNIGAGLGAAAGKVKGGLGSASVIDDDGLQVGALVAVNPVGSVTMPGGNNLWAAPFEMAGEFGGLGLPALRQELDLALASAGRLGGHTCIGVVATNAALDKGQAWRVAMMGHDGLARAIRPVHTPFDGDTLFSLSTARLPLPEPVPLGLTRIGHLAADCVARAVVRAVLAAESLGATPGLRSLVAGVTPGS